MSAKFCIVSQDHLPDTPQGFQEYVEQYFEETLILGQKCFYAFRISDGYYFSLFNTSLKDMKGVAPLIIGKRKDHGISSGLTLDEWIESESREPAETRLVDQNIKSWSEATIDIH